MAVKGTYTTDPTDMPQTMAFDDLLKVEGFNDYVERNGLWHIIFDNGAYYTQDRNDSEVGQRCSPNKLLDKNTMTSVW